MDTFFRILRWLARGLWVLITLPFVYVRFTLAGDDRTAFFSLPVFYRQPRDTVQSALAELDYTEPVAPAWMSGGGLQSTRHGDIVFEGYGAGGGHKLPLPDSNRALVIGTGFGFTQVGLVLLRRGRLRVYPLVGAGGMGGSIVPATESPDSPGELMLNEAGAIDTGGGPLVNFGVGADVRLGGRVGAIFGIRAGVMLPIAGPSSRRFYVHLTGGPVASRPGDAVPPA